MLDSYSIANSLKRIMQSKKITISQLSDLSNVPEDTIKSIRSGRTRNPGMQIMIQLADALSCSLDELSSRTFSNCKGAELLSKWNLLGNHGKKLVEAIIELESSYVDDNNMNPAAEKRKLSCMVPLTHSGGFLSYKAALMESIEISNKDFYHADFCLRITSNALAPVYFLDDVLAIEKRFPSSGEIGIFIRKDTIYIRKYIAESRHIHLDPLSPACKLLKVNSHLDGFICLGTILGIIR